MWLMVLAMVAVMILAMFGVMVFVMVMLHRKPRGASVHDARGKQVD